MANRQQSVITKTKSKLLEPSPVFDSLTFKNDEKAIIDVKKVLQDDTQSAIDLLSDEAKIRKITDPTFNKILGKKSLKTGTTLLPRFDPFPNALPPTHQPILKQKTSRKNNKEKR